MKTLLEHKRQGLEPDVIVVHPGWGDALYLRDVFPGAKIVGLFEYFYSARGADVGFDSEFPINFNNIINIHSLNSIQLLALESCDLGICPTEWQRARFPAHYQSRLKVIHDGIDTQLFSPDPSATLTLPDGSTFSAGDEVLTFVNRNLEPYRGYHVFMRALPEILRTRPNCHAIIIGADGVSYGQPAPPGTTWREHYLSEVKDQLDLSRVHFTGPLPYDTFRSALQVSRLHAYLTYPFVLSWSMLEAMATGCIVLGSATAPIEEVIRHGENGLLFPFRNHRMLASMAIDILTNPEKYAHLRMNARASIVEKYDFLTKSLPAFQELLSSLSH